MRTRRGLLAGIGASTALVAAGTLALLALSAVIAFNGWPSSPLSAHDTPVLVLQPAAAGATAQRAAEPIVVAAPAARGVTKRAASAGSAHR
ncbi:MAG TPA: hypothetical protein VFT42_03890, partial [Solirubrobacteraceae bacterium]|nr:hypothetical protein [Solirubrobacteraceae bacterium]